VTTLTRTRFRITLRGVAGVTVQLKDGSGAVVATDVTDSAGRYRFDYQNGINGTGDYTVHLVAPRNATETSPDPVTVLVSRGDVNATVNFSLSSDGGWTGWAAPDAGWAGPYSGWRGGRRYNGGAPAFGP
jgi:hypothetical protein